MPSKFLTVKDLAALFNLRESWIYDRTSGNGPEVIPHVKFGRQVRFDIESTEFRAWLKAHGVVTQVAETRSLTA
jgi:predicted DNA-binding transcriptional regulator AlpA